MHQPIARRAGPADTAALAGLRRAWIEEQHGGPIDDPDFEAAFADWYAAEARHRLTWLAADRGGEPIGMVNLLVVTRMPRPGRAATRWGYVGNAYVAAAHRDRGVGALLIAAVLAHADAEGLVRVVLSPSERSREFYRRAGFGAADMLLARLPAG
jgi:GNAT superfamily N-acetyltransferase